MDIDKLAELIEAVEKDPTVPDRQYLFDGDPEEWPVSLKNLDAFFETHFIGRENGMKLKNAGFNVSFNHDCICIVTKKGLANTGSDNM